MARSGGRCRRPPPPTRRRTVDHHHRTTHTRTIALQALRHSAHEQHQASTDRRQDRNALRPLFDSAQPPSTLAMTQARKAATMTTPRPPRRSGWQRQGKPTASARVTRSSSWKRVRQSVLDRDEHRCRIRGPRCIGVATIVDKRIPASIAPALAEEPDNLQAVCRPCHTAKTAKEAAEASKRSPRRRTQKRPARIHPSEML